MSFGNPFAQNYEDESGALGLGFNGFEVSLNYVSGVPDPNILSNSSLKLIFRSVLKRDELTKEKALGELVSFIENPANLDELKDDLVLITWIQLYPKLAISESKTVRTLSHQVQTQLMSLLKKSYVKYLKDTVPVLLTGIYDFDSSVSNSTLKNLGKVFDNDQVKVNNLWVMFQNEILNLADQALNKETVDTLADDRYVPRDEAELKYLRLINATISIVSHLIQIGFKVNAPKLEKNLAKYQEFFLYENLWHYLLVNSNANNQRIFKTLLSLIAAVTRVKLELFTEKAWKLLSKRFLKSLSFASKVDKKSPNIVVYSSLIVPIISTLNTLNNANPDFYEYDKNHKERITSFLKLGSLNSDASYYSQLSKFLKDSHIYDLKETIDVNIIEQILHEDFASEVSKNLKLRAGAPFIVESLRTYIEIISKADYSKISSFVDEVLDIVSPVTIQFVDPLAEGLPESLVQEKLVQYAATENTNIDILLKVAERKSIDLSSTLEVSLGSLQEKVAQNIDGTSYEKHNAFKVFDYVLLGGKSEYKEILEKFLLDLPSLISDSVTDQPVKILIHYSKSELYDNRVFMEAFNGSLERLTALDQKDKLLSQLDSFKNRHELMSISDKLKDLVLEATSSVDFSDDDLFKSHLITKESVVDLYKSAKEQDKVETFVDLYWKNNSSDDDLLSHILKETSFSKDFLWKSPLKVEILAKVENLSKSDEEIRALYINSLKDAAVESGGDELADHLNAHLGENQTLISDLVGTESLKVLVASYGEVIDSRLSLGNPLEANIYILPHQEKSLQFESLLPIIKFGIFLSKLKAEFSDDVLIYLSILSEIAIDYEFLITKSEISNDTVISFHKSTQLLLSEKFESEPFNIIASQVMTKNFNSSLLEKLSTETNVVLSFYKNRLLKQILSTKESLSINDLDVDTYVKSQIPSKDIPSILLFTTLISTIREFLSDDKYERTRNLVGSELIGLRPSEILSNGLTKLTIFNNFLSAKDDDDTYNPLQPQRFNMIINDFNKWLDSDVAYEPEFHAVRIQLILLLIRLNALEFEKTDGFNELTLRVLQDSTGLISIGEGEGLLELKYYSLKLYLVLEKKKGVQDDLKDVQVEILESFINDDTTETNQAVIVYNESLNRILDKIPITKFNEYYDTLLSKYEKITNIELRRSLLSIISKLILSRQQDVVIEFELNKDENVEFKINKFFIDNVLKVPDLIEDDYQNDVKLIRYLWDWSLVLLHFKEITLKLRSIYIQQLQLENDQLITKFLNFLSVLVVNIDDKELLNQINESHEIFQEYDCLNATDDLFKEIRILGINLYYTILTSIGSLSSSWYHDIKDRGFKANLEAFTQKYISPSLIEEKISKFEAKSSSFTKDPNLSLKINRITNEIKTTYLIDEQNMEVVFKIPANYPLSNIEVTGPQRIGVKENQWRAWLLASQRIISLQNGEISESLEFFMKNVSFHFKGFEECAICYSILHQDNSLPSKTCVTCKNKFHAGCLYKWFKSSGGSTCPLCRSTFNFR